MKRIVALFLIAALLLGVLGTSAFAAEAAALTIPEFTASIAADGSITVTVGGGKSMSMLPRMLTMVPASVLYMYG